MSNKVLAAALKSAVNTAALKQVAAGGFYVSRSACTFSGTKAYAVWSDTWTREGHYSGKGSRQFRINYPAMPDDALLSRVEADLIAAYTLHETGHVIYTPNDRTTIRYMPLSERLHTLANGFEDGRMEQCVIVGGVARNARQLFSRLLNKLTADIGKGWNPCDIANAPFAIALLARDALGNGNSFTAGLLDRIPEPYRAIYQTVVDDSKTAPMGFDDKYWSYRMANKFYRAWAEMRKETPQEQPEEQDEPQGEPEPEEQGPTVPDDDGDVAGPPGLTEDDFEDESDDDFDDESDEDFDNAEDTELPEPGKSEGTGEDEGDGDAEGSAEGDEQGDAEDDAEGGGGDTGTGYSETGDSGPPKSPEPNIDDIFKRINKRSDGNKRSSLGAFTPAPRNLSVMDYLKSRGTA